MAVLGLVLRIYVEPSHLPGQLFFLLLLLLLLFLSLLLILLLGLLLGLSLPEHVEHVLVVQDRVRKLVLEVILVQQSLHASLDLGVLQDLIYVGPLVGVFMQHLRKQVRDDLAKVGRHVSVLALNDFLR